MAIVTWPTNSWNIDETGFGSDGGCCKGIFRWHLSEDSVKCTSNVQRNYFSLDGGAQYVCSRRAQHV